MWGALALLVGALTYCSFGPDEYTGPFPPEAPSDDGGAGGAGGSMDDGGGPMDDGSTEARPAR